VQPPVQPALPAAEEADPAAIAKAREALRLKMQQLEAAQPAPGPLTPPPASSLTQAPPVAPPPPAAQPPPIPAALTAQPATTPPPPTLPNLAEVPGADPAAIEKAREAVRLKMETLPPSSMEPQLVGTSGYVRPPERIVAPGNFPAMAGPALPISVDKQQLLDALLLRYRADQITPEQYHAERAKILGTQ
jgi:hypothetical protein